MPLALLLSGGKKENFHEVHVITKFTSFIQHLWTFNTTATWVQ